MQYGLRHAIVTIFCDSKNKSLIETVVLTSADHGGNNKIPRSEP
jgi:hypothetical protein